MIGPVIFLSFAALLLVGTPIAVTAGMQWSEWIFRAFVSLGAFFITVEFLFMLIDTISGREGDAK